jgi:hypothetical protein
VSEVDDMRAAALDAYLDERVAHGFRVETRTRTQAVIHRRRRAYLPLFWLRTAAGHERHVVSVTHDGAITTAEAQPVRW